MCSVPVVFLVREGRFLQIESHAQILLLIVAAHHHVVALSSKAYRALFVKRATFTNPTVRWIEAGAKDLRLPRNRRSHRLFRTKVPRHLTPQATSFGRNRAECIRYACAGSRGVGKAHSFRSGDRGTEFRRLPGPVRRAFPVLVRRVHPNHAHGNTQAASVRDGQPRPSTARMGAVV